MNKQTKLLTLLGILSLLTFPSVLYAQRYVTEGRAAIKVTSQLTELGDASARAIAERDIQRGIAGARLITGVRNVMPPFYNMQRGVSLTGESQEPMHIEIQPLSVQLSDAWGPFRTQMMDQYDLTTVDAQAVAAGTHNNLEAVEEAIAHGAKPEMALFGALSQGYLELADKIAEDCEVNVNAVLFDNKTILELLPNIGKEYTDERLPWLLEHGLNPDLVMTSGIYQQIERSGFFIELVEKGLNPMAFFGKTKYTALHWYAEKFFKYDYDKEGDFLVNWVAKFPKTNVNVQDVLGNTPAHYVKANSPNELNAFGRLKGFDPTIENKEGLLPENYRNGCYNQRWAYRAKALREKIEEMIYMYKYDARYPSATQRRFATTKSVDYLHNPNPKKLVEYFISLGATPQAIEETFRVDESDDEWSNYSLRQDIAKVLYEEYGVIPPVQEPVERWHKYLGPDYDESL